MQTAVEYVAGLNHFDIEKVSEDGYQIVDFFWSEETATKPWIVENREGKRFRASYMFVFDRFKVFTAEQKLKIEEKQARKTRKYA